MRLQEQQVGGAKEAEGGAERGQTPSSNTTPRFWRRRAADRLLTGSHRTPPVGASGRRPNSIPLVIRGHGAPTGVLLTFRSGAARFRYSRLALPR